MAPGSMPAPLARRFKDRSGEVALTMEGGRSRVVLRLLTSLYGIGSLCLRLL